MVIWFNVAVGIGIVIPACRRGNGAGNWYPKQDISEPFQNVHFSAMEVRVRAALPDVCGETTASRSSGCSCWSQP